MHDTQTVAALVPGVGWDELMDLQDHELTPVESLRRTARAAVREWIGALDGRRDRVEECRRAKGLTLAEIAAEFRVDQSTVYRWEKTGRVPVQKIPALAKLLDVDAAYLMGWDVLPAEASR